MARRVRCPICGHLFRPLNIAKWFPIEVYILHGLGYGRGFSFEPIQDISLVESVKAKILALYEHFFKLGVESGSFQPLGVESGSFQPLDIVEVEPLNIGRWDIVG